MVFILYRTITTPVFKLPFVTKSELFPPRGVSKKRINITKRNAARRWRHLNFFQYRCELVAKVPRTWCRKDGVHQVQAPWAREGSGFLNASGCGEG